MLDSTQLSQFFNFNILSKVMERASAESRARSLNYTTKPSGEIFGKVRRIGQQIRAHRLIAVDALNSGLGDVMTNEELRAEVARLENLLKASKTARLSLRVSAKGAVSLYGLGKFPVTLYSTQWERLITFAGDIKAFIEANRDQLAVKGAPVAEAQPAAQ
jgi:hypothetical protein